jgi:GNAT superfamily N-acetyltransferase
MEVSLRRAEAADAPVLGEICYRAFRSIAEAHNFPPDMPEPEVGIGLVSQLIANDGFFGVAAEQDGALVGSNFLDERNPITGVGPITVDPDVQNDGVGRALMQAVIERSQARGFAGIRLVQSGYHNRSLSLYLKLGFDVREQLACLQGPAIGETPQGFAVRPAAPADAAACNRLCLRVHGHERPGELAEAIASGAARVALRAGRITGYATTIGFFGHAVGETNEDLQALIGSAEAFAGPGFLAPTRNGELMRWCLGRGLRVTQMMTLMSMGLYNDPDGAWLPSILY